MTWTDIYNSKTFRRGVFLLSSFGLVYIILRLLVFETDPLLPFFSNFFYNWLGINEWIAAAVVEHIGLPYEIDNHNVISEGTILYEFTPMFLNRKWIIGLLAIIWFFPVGIRNKLLGTVSLLVLHFFFTSLDMVILISRATTENVTDHSAYLVARSPGVFMLISFLIFWILTFRSKIYPFIERFKINPDYIEKRLPEIFVIMYLYGFLSNFILGWFEYASWIQFLFATSAKILAVFGYEAEVFLTYLIGENGSIYMEKGCLGFGTMALFAAVVYLTAENTKSWWIYMLVGIIFLNIVNILRFVFLFIHIQKHSGYALSMDVHDMYNLILYAVVFILWVIWFEAFVLKKPAYKKS